MIRVRDFCPLVAGDDGILHVIVIGRVTARATKENAACCQAAHLHRFVTDRFAGAVEFLTLTASESASCFEGSTGRQLQRALQTDNYDLLVAESLDRISRDYEEVATILNKIRVITVAQRFDSDWADFGKGGGSW